MYPCLRHSYCSHICARTTLRSLHLVSTWSDTHRTTLAPRLAGFLDCLVLAMRCDRQTVASSHWTHAAPAAYPVILRCHTLHETCNVGGRRLAGSRPEIGRVLGPWRARDEHMSDVARRHHMRTVVRRAQYRLYVLSCWYGTRQEHVSISKHRSTTSYLTRLLKRIASCT